MILMTTKPHDEVLPSRKMAIDVFQNRIKTECPEREAGIIPYIRASKQRKNEFRKT
jgi:hypothetical protein